eukprot:gene19926-25887_t
MNVYGSPEYPSLLNTGLQSARVVKYEVLGNDSEVSKNYKLVTEDGTALTYSITRSADDYEIWDETCVGLNDPYSNCTALNYATQRSAQRPPCTDNNSSLNALSSCYYPNGTKRSYCVQVAYMQNNFIAVCSDSVENCGTFLEIHMPSGSPYQSVDEKISEVKLETRNVSGAYTTVIPLTWMKNSSRVLCAYTESYLRIGSTVYIQSSAPTCCCPKVYTSTTRTGSLQCPKGPTGNGAYAYKFTSITDMITVDEVMLEFPFCPTDLSAKNDSVIQSSNTSSITTYSSSNLTGDSYLGICPYYDCCSTTQFDGTCNTNDLTFTFVGQVGIVTSLDDTSDIPTVMVSFNNGRTSYKFAQSHVILETYKSMYEIWWVLRTKSNYIIQKRKGFNITSPTCTFDATNNRYFPFAELTDAGTTADISLV